MFFKQMHKYLLFFTIFGMWSTWECFKNKHKLQACSILSIILGLIWSSSAYLLDMLYAYNSLSNTVANLLHILMVLTHLIIVVESIVQKKSQLKLIQKISNVDTSLNSKLKVLVPYREEKQALFVRCFILISIVVFVLIFFVTYANIKNIYYNLMYPSMFANFFIRLRSIQILFWVYLVRTRYILIVNELKRIQIEMYKMTNNERLLNHDGRSEINSANNSIKANECVYDRILNLKLIYGELNESCELINNIFGTSLLALTLQNFVNFTTHCYWPFLLLFDFDTFVLSVCLLIPIVVVFGSLAFYCSSCFENVSNFFAAINRRNVLKNWLSRYVFMQGRLIEVNLHRIPTDREIEPLNDLIREFSLQVHHQQFIITANGYFIVNLNLVSTVSHFISMSKHRFFIILFGSLEKNH